MSGVLVSDILEQLSQDRPGPSVTSVAGDTFEELSVFLLFLLFGHVQSVVDSLGDTEQVVRVDLKSRVERSGGAHELRKDQRRFVSLILTEDELHRRGVHAVSQRGDQSEVGHRQEAEVLVALDGLVAMVSADSRTHKCKRARTSDEPG